MMESESCEFNVTAENDGRDNTVHMVVNLKIIEARNIFVKTADKRANMFVRYHLRSGDGEGNNVVVNTKEVMVTSCPEWKQTFCLECRGSLCDLQKEFVKFELRKRSKTKIFGVSMDKSSKVVGWVEIAWKDLLASHTSSINSWFPLMCTTDTSHIIRETPLPPSLHLAISLRPLSAFDSVSRFPQHDRLEIQERNWIPRISRSKVADVLSWGVESNPSVVIRKMENPRKASMNMTVNSRVRRLERCDRVGCEGLLGECTFGMI